MKKIFLLKLILLFGLLTLPFFVFADTQGDKEKFFIDPSFDFQAREEIRATLRQVSDKAYFYLEDDWYSDLEEKEIIDKSLESLAKEFDQVIYPDLTSNYGEEWKPGIDSDYHVVILFHQMKEDTAGYFRSKDEYEKMQSPGSNEREMIYLNTDYLNQNIIKSYVAHEFTHLITFNQKDRLRGVSEETWLNESRADYAPTLLGYDDDYSNSNLQQRVRTFLNNPSDSLTEWKLEKGDYGIINVFTQYVADHYGKEILIDSLKSPEIGIESINKALEENGFKETFSDIFTDWSIAIFLNDCRFGEKYCYKNKNLKNFKINPSLIFLPSTQRTSISLDYEIKDWSGNWYRIMGGEGNLELKVDGQDSASFEFPYVLCKDNTRCKVEFLDLNDEQEGITTVEDFERYSSLTLIPSVQSLLKGFNGEEPSYSFSISASIESKTQEELIDQLKAKIKELKAKIAELQAKLYKKLSQKESCQLINNLSYGMNSEEVKCLQQFLKSQGKEIYPEGLVTGFFGPLTQKAVIRFQEKYKEAILRPWGIEKGTGYVGKTTRAKINQLMK